MKNITLNGIEYTQVGCEISLEEFNKVKEELSWLKHEIERNYEYAQNVLQDYKESGLTFNSIEAEGYLRASKTIYEQLKYISENI